MKVYEFLMSYMRDCNTCLQFHTILRIKVENEKQAEELLGCSSYELLCLYATDGYSDIFYSDGELKKCYFDGLISQLEDDYIEETLMPCEFLGVSEVK